MNTAIEETATTEKPKATKKACGGAQGAHVAPKKGKIAKKAKAPKAEAEEEPCDNEAGASGKHSHARGRWRREHGAIRLHQHDATPAYARLWLLEGLLARPAPRLSAYSFRAKT